MSTPTPKPTLWKKVTAKVTIRLTPKDLNGGHARQVATHDAFSSLLMRYSKPLGGVIVSHGTLDFGSDAKAKFIGANPFARIMATAELLLFFPQKDSILTGTVTYLGPDHIALSVLSTFHTIIPLTNLPPSYTLTTKPPRSYVHPTLPPITLGTRLRLKLESVSSSKSGLFQMRGSALGEGLGVIDGEERGVEEEDGVLGRFMEGEGVMEELVDLTGVGGFGDALVGEEGGGRGIEGEMNGIVGEEVEGEDIRKEGEKECMKKRKKKDKGKSDGVDGLHRWNDGIEEDGEEGQIEGVNGGENSDDMNPANESKGIAVKKESSVDEEIAKDAEQKALRKAKRKARRERKEEKRRRKKARKAKIKAEKEKEESERHKAQLAIDTSKVKVRVEPELVKVKNDIKHDEEENVVEPANATIRTEPQLVKVKHERKKVVKEEKGASTRHQNGFRHKDGEQVDVKVAVKDEALLDTGKRKRDKSEEEEHVKKKRKKKKKKKIKQERE